MTDSPIAMNRDAYDRVAPAYAARNAEMQPYLVEAAARMAAHLKAHPGRLLDLGCGTGRDLAWFSGQEQLPRASLFGADLSGGMLAVARQNASPALAQMDMRYLGYSAGAFQGVWCVAALLHLPKRLAPAALAEMARVLSPGGRLFLSVQKGDGEGLEPTPYDESIQRFYASYQPDELAGLLGEAGLLIYKQGDSPGRRPWLWFEAGTDRPT